MRRYQYDDLDTIKNGGNTIDFTNEYRTIVIKKNGSR